VRRAWLALVAATATGLRLLAPSIARADEAAPDTNNEDRPKNRLIVEALGGARQLLVERIRRVEVPGTGIDPNFSDEVHPMSTPIPIYGGGIAIGAGYHPSHGHGGALLAHYEMGSTDYGLRTHTLFLDAEWHYVFLPRWSTLVGLRLGYLAVERATDGPLIAHWGLGANAGVSVDVMDLDGHALFVRPEIDAMIIPHSLIEPRSLLWGGVLGVGVRW
jgi:hypothetical protein